MKYGLLNQRHPDYHAEAWAELDVLHRGGIALTNEWRSRLLPPKVDHRGKPEHGEQYRQRITRAAYINYFGRVVAFFAQALASKSLHVAVADDSDGDSSKIENDAYEAFAEDADRKGTAFQSLCIDVLTTALVKGKGLLAVDMPQAPEPGEVQSRADEERLGLTTPYAFEVPVEELIDWRHDDTGGFEWAVLHRTICDRATPLASRDTFVEEFKVWGLVAGKDSRPAAAWKLFRTEPMKVGQRQERQNDYDVPLVAEGVTAFQRVPLIELMLPEALWIGDHIGPLAKEHFQRRSGIIHAEDRTLYAIPFVKLGPQVLQHGGAILADVAQDQSRGDDPIAQAESRGWMTLASEDDIGFASPDPAAYQHAHERLDALVDEIFRIAHQMAQSITSTGKALQRSGVSKTEDRHSTEIVLLALGDEVRSFAKMVYDCISAARGDEVYWQASGLDTFEIWDREQLVAEGKEVKQVGIPSKTFQKRYFAQVAGKLLGDVTPELMAEIEEEIETAVDKMPEPGEEPPPVIALPNGKPPFGAKPPMNGKPASPPFGAKQAPPPRPSA